MAIKYIPDVAFKQAIENIRKSLAYYGTCSTAAATAAKTVAVAGFTLAAGARVIVKFTYANTAASPTLNVNGTGAKTMQYNGVNITSSTPYLLAGGVYAFVYDGTYYQLLSDGSKEGLIRDAAAKTTLVDADTMPLSDSTASNATKKITFAQLKAIFKTYFDTLYTTALLKMTGYSKATTSANVAATDTINVAVGKIEKKVDDAVAGLSNNGDMLSSVYDPQGLKRNAFLSQSIYLETLDSTNTDRNIIIPGISSLDDIEGIPLLIQSNTYGAFATQVFLKINELDWRPLSFPKIGSNVYNASPSVGWVHHRGVYAVVYQGFSFLVLSLQNQVKELMADPTFTGTISAANINMSGNLLLKGSGNFGNKISFGDSDYVHLYEIADDTLQIKGSRINLLGTVTVNSNMAYHAGNITISNITPAGVINDGYIHHVY